jgi:hypothetical protein
MPGALPPSPRARPGSKATWPDASVDFVASTSLLRATSRISTLGSGSAVASERTKACTPSLPLKAVSPRSETTNHCVARGL